MLIASNQASSQVRDSLQRSQQVKGDLDAAQRDLADTRSQAQAQTSRLESKLGAKEADCEGLEQR